jgi:hypothetical protein
VNGEHNTREGGKMKRTFVGEWHTSTAPNGSTSCVERRLHTVEIYSADYYGKGPKEYARGHFNIEIQVSESETRTGPGFGDWDDGHPEAVAEWKRKVGA